MWCMIPELKLFLYSVFVMFLEWTMEFIQLHFPLLYSIIIQSCSLEDVAQKYHVMAALPSIGVACAVDIEEDIT